ncbi:hypothetical protein [Psychromonas sp. MME2]|uniref:hypothetical protein n=1 Tax=Psychromonas sp. MME2 TaxID=3231033 RepID=UPI00339BE07B
MNICFFIRDLKIEGVQVVTIRLAEEIAKHGHHVTILTVTDEHELTVASSINVEFLSKQENVHGLNLKNVHHQFIAWLTEKESHSTFDAIIASHSETIKITAGLVLVLLLISITPMNILTIINLGIENTVLGRS